MSFAYPEQAVDYCIETLLLIWFFSGIRPVNRTERQTAYSALVLVALAILYPLYPSATSVVTTIVSIILRVVLRTALCGIYLRLDKGIPWRFAAYFSSIYTAAFHTYLNIVSLPLVKNLLDSGIPDPLEAALFADCFTHCVEFILLWLLRWEINFNEIEHLGSGRLGMAATVMTCVIYAKSTISFVQPHLGEYSLTVSGLLVLMHICLLMMIILMERYFKLQREQEAEQLRLLASTYALRNLEQWKIGQENTRALAHDIKNHLAAIRQLAAGENGKAVAAYVDDILGSFDLSLHDISTGHPLLDGLLSEKAATAAKSGIELSVILDSRLLHFISDIDLCILFGNTLDNAIEASSQVEDPSARYITLRSTYAAGQTVVTISNTCRATPILKENEILPQTTKIDGLHGIGLKNVFRTLKKYDGFLALDTKKQGRFTLSMLIPDPK